MKKLPCVFMRGGTSKGAVFHKADLPEDIKEWDEIFLKTMGSPDPKQIDGLGGCVSSYMKIVGRAFTVQLPYEDSIITHNAIEEAQVGDVLVINSNIH